MLDQVRKKFEELDDEADKFYTNGVKAAGTRARKAAQELKRLLSEMRKHIQITKQEVK